jgi:hypothetical protein
MTPEGLRSGCGATVVRVFYPLDWLIRSMTDMRRINLEIALFARQASGCSR